MPRYLIQQANTPIGLYGTDDTEIPYKVGQIHDELVSEDGTTKQCVVTAVKPSPDPDYDWLVVFAFASPKH